MYKLPNIVAAMESFAWNWRRSDEDKVKKMVEADCAHTKCGKCGGSGKTKDGSICLHLISCRCSRCNKHSL